MPKQKEGFNRQHSRPSDYITVCLVPLTLDTNLHQDQLRADESPEQALVDALGEQRETALILYKLSLERELPELLVTQS